MTYNTDQDRSR